MYNHTHIIYIYIYIHYIISNIRDFMRLLRVRFDDSWGKIPCERGTRRVWLCFAPAIWSLYSGRLHAMEWSLLWSPLDHAVTFYPVASLYQCDKTHRELAQVYSYLPNSCAEPCERASDERAAESYNRCRTGLMIVQVQVSRIMR